MTLINGKILELERLLAITLDPAEKEHFDGLYEQHKRIHCQPKTANIIYELENYISQNRHLIGITEQGYIAAYACKYILKVFV